MKKKWIIPALAAFVIGGSTIGLTAAHAATPSKQKVVQTQDTSEKSDGKDVNESANLAKTEKVNESQAKATATQKVPGTVQNTQLENENGKGVYNVQVKTAKNKLVGVKVDDQTGKVVKVETNKNNDNEQGYVEKVETSENTNESAEKANNETNQGSEKDKVQVEQQGQN